MKYMLIMRTPDETHAAYENVDFNDVIPGLPGGDQNGRCSPDSRISPTWLQPR